MPSFLYYSINGLITYDIGIGAIIIDEKNYFILFKRVIYGCFVIITLLKIQVRF